MQLITTTVTHKQVVDGMTQLSKVTSFKVTPPAIVAKHPVVATYVAYRAGKKLGRFVRNHRNGTVHKHYYNQVSSREVAVAEVDAD